MKRTLGGRGRLAEMAINRVGAGVTIKRLLSPPAENEYGKTPDSSPSDYDDVTTEVAHRIYASRNDFPNEARVTGGRIDSENPRLAFKEDTQAQEDDIVEFEDTGRQYVLDERIPRQTHVEFRSTFING